MNTRYDDRLVAHLSGLISEGHFDELFSRGGCFHFALCAFKQGIGDLHCTISGYDLNEPDHVFVISPDGRAFDRLGYRPLAELLEERQARDFGHRAAMESEIADHIASMHVPPELHEEIYRIAAAMIPKLRRPE